MVEVTWIGSGIAARSPCLCVQERRASAMTAPRTIFSGDRDATARPTRSGATKVCWLPPRATRRISNSSRRRSWRLPRASWSRSWQRRRGGIRNGRHRRARQIRYGDRARRIYRVNPEPTIGGEQEGDARPFGGVRVVDVHEVKPVLSRSRVSCYPEKLGLPSH
jgi:hypothetical protein